MRQHEQALLLLRSFSAACCAWNPNISLLIRSEESTSARSAASSIAFFKALLSEFGVNFPRTHNLRLLMDLLADAGHSLPSTLADLDLLTPYGTLFRYEDIPAEVGLDRKAAFEIIGVLRELVEQKLGRQHNKS